MGTKWDRSNSVEWDSNGDRAIGALAYFYDAGTSTPRAVYSTAALSSALTQPVAADGNGRWPSVFLQFGDFKETVTTAGGSQIWTTDNIPNPEPFDESFTLDTTAIYNTGDYIIAGANTTRAGAVRCNGRTIGNATSGGTERANADTAALFAYLWNNYANGQAAVSTGRGASAASDYAANKTVVLPDHRSAGLVGFDDMGSTAAGLAASAPVVSGSAILAGSIIGANTHTLTTAQLASHTHGTTGLTIGAGTAHTHGLGTLATTTTGSNHTHVVTDPTHQHGIHYNGPSNVSTAGAAFAISTIGVAQPIATAATDFVATGITVNSNDGTHTHTFSGALANESAHTHSFVGTIDTNGSGTAHNNLGRVTPVTILMKL